MNAPVYMNHGRWVFDCPHPDCAWSYPAMTEDGRPRYLCRCTGDRNGHGCGTRIDTVWPPLDVAIEIERLLFLRSNRLNRNWRYPETVETLLRENDAHLVGWTLETLATRGIGTI